MRWLFWSGGQHEAAGFYRFVGGAAALPLAARAQPSKIGKIKECPSRSAYCYHHCSGGILSSIDRIIQGREYAGCCYASLDFNDAGHVVYALDPACAWLDRDDVDLEPPIRLDAIHQVVSREPAYQSSCDPDHIFHCDCAADLAVAATGLSRRQIRRAAADCNR